MENAVDALKMAGAAMLFIIAFTIAMTMFSKARETTDAVLDNLQISDFFPKVDSLDMGVTREVGIETIIPTLYRYCQSDENIRVRILDTNGTTELQVFDTEIESIIRTYSGTSSTDPYISYLLTEYNTMSKPAYMYQAPWNGQTEQYTLERINAYIYGKSCKHMPDVKYGPETTNPSNYLMKYAERTFTETYVEYNTSGQVYKDDYGEEIVTIPAETKTIITYKLK